jgi:hypothetical protein
VNASAALAFNSIVAFVLVMLKAAVVGAATSSSGKGHIYHKA